MKENPLRSREYPIPFDRIEAEHVVPGTREALAEAQAEVEAILADPAPPTYASTLQRLDGALERVSRPARIVSHLASTCDSEALRAAYATVQPEITSFFARVGSDPRLFARLTALAGSGEGRALDPLRRRHLDKSLRELRRSGAALPAEERERVVELRIELARLGKTFRENALDAGNEFALDLTDEADLAGLPESVVAAARERARDAGVEGWRFTLDAPSRVPFLENSERRGLRREVYEAQTTRATRGERDNRPLIGRILSLRRELAERLGYRDYADLVLEERMVGSGERALAFVDDLAERTRPHFLAEAAELEAFARQELGLGDPEPSDIPFAAERMRRARFDLDPEELRPYLSLDRVLEGLFSLAARLFGVSVREKEVAGVWHPDVRYFEIHDEKGVHRGSFYADFFPRRTKRDGAWMGDLLSGGPSPEGFRPHLAVIVCNFTPPTREAPSLLTHDEVQTLFHEFGHLLHHSLSVVEIPERGGINVAWDFVELPSQIMENWTWEREALDLFARHHETGESLPQALLDRMLAARSFRGASAQMTQLAYGSVDLWLHTRFDPRGEADPLEAVRPVWVPFVERPEWVRTERLASFTHVFSGGYAAGYYSYKWAEVLDADAFGRFLAEGVLNEETGRAFREMVLEKGDSEDAAALFRAFRGRDPDPEALLRRTLGPAAATVS